MNTEHLVYILEAYKCGSVNKAARNCYISQSHLSTIIKNVEQEIGYPLFHRTANGITATPEGLGRGRCTALVLLLAAGGFFPVCAPLRAVRTSASSAGAC